MTTYNSYKDSHGTPLEAFTKSTPPGWDPGQSDTFPLRAYVERLRLFTRMTDLRQNQIGPAMAGRLKGRAFHLAMALTITCPRTGNIMVGDEALAFEGYAPEYDQAGNVLPGADSGVKQLLHVLRAKYGAEEQKVSTRSIDLFEEHYRHDRMTLLEYLNEFDYRYSQAEQLANYAINNIGRTHRLLKGARVHKEMLDIVLSKVDYDKTRFDEIYNLLMKKAKTTEPTQIPSHRGLYASYYVGDDDEFDYTNDWTEPDAYDYYYGTDTDYHDWSEYNDYDDYYDTEENAHSDHPEHHDEWPDENYYYGDDDYYDDPYTPSDDYYFGKGKGKFRRPFRKGKGKGKGKFHRPYHKGKGKGKGDREALSLFGKGDKGKGKGSKGKSKGKGKHKGMDSTSVGKSSGMLGCSSCGSSNHNAGDCPWQQGQSSSAHLAQPAADEVPSSSSAAASSSSGQHTTRNNFVNYSTPARTTTHAVSRTFFQQNLFDPQGKRPSPAEPTSSQQPLTSLMDINLNPVSTRAVTFEENEPSSTTQPRADFFYMNMNMNMDITRSPRYMMAVNNDTKVTTDALPTPVYSCTVNGMPQLGLIYDPGAPDGIVGTDTLLAHVRAKDGVTCKEISKLATSFRGISDADVPCKMRVAVTFKIAAHPVTLECNTIGGTGSTCPFLFPNRALLCSKSLTAHNYFENRDALLCIETNGTVLGIRMLLTDSGHHMIMHNDNRNYHKDAKKILDSVHPPRTATTTRGGRPESESRTPSSLHYIGDHDDDEPPPTDIDDIYNADWPTITNKTDPSGAIEPPPGLSLMTAVTPIDIHCALCGTKENMDTMISCIDCLTTCCVRCSRQGRCNVCHETIDANIPTSTTTTHNEGDHSYHLRSMKIMQGVIHEWDNDYYDGIDKFPASVDATTKHKMTIIKEEYYSSTRTPVLRPSNCKKFIEMHLRAAQDLGQQPPEFDFIEMWSCSARTSYYAHKLGLKVMGPLDYRYGWDLMNPQHRALAGLLVQTFKVKVILAAPDCRVWSCSATTADPQATQEARRAQEPMLTWLSKIGHRQVREGRNIIVEQPHSATSWKKSPLRTLFDDTIKRYRVSQCQHGAVHPQSGRPIRKDTSLATNMQLPSVFKTCHGGHQHEPLQGRHSCGLNNTALAAVYPRQMARRIIVDIKNTLAMSQTAVLWSCPACNGNPVNHTRVTGQCQQAEYRPPGEQRRRELPASRGVAPVTRDTPITPPAPVLPRGRPLPGVRFRISAEDADIDSAVDPPAPEDPDAPVPGEEEAPVEEAPRAQLPTLPPRDPTPGAQDPDTDGTVTLDGLKTTLKELKDCAYPSRDFNMRLIWLHKKFWHAPSSKLKPLLIYGGVPADRLTNMDEVLKLCEICGDHAHQLSRPQIRTTLPVRFNYMVEIDHFQCGGINYLLITDRTFFYKQGTYVRDLTATEAVRAFMTVWIRYFGPPKYTIVDQGSSLANTEFGAFCAKISSERIVAGTGTAASSARPAEHTHTGGVEKAVDLIRIAMVKIRAEADENNIALTGEELIAEACAAHNCLLTYKGCTPVAGVLGINGTVDLFDMDSTSPDAFGSPDPGDFAEKAVRLRHWAKIATLRSVVEYRIARAQTTRPQQVNLAEITVGSYVDMYRRPAAKDLPGWRGPCRVLETNRDTGTTIVLWQGRPWLISLRHVRKHRGFIHAMTNYASSCASSTTWNQIYLTDTKNNDNSAANNNDQHQQAVISLMKMMDMTDGSQPCQVHVFGNIWDEKRSRYIFINNVPGSSNGHQLIDQSFNQIAQVFLAIFPYSGVMFGTMVRKINPVPRANHGYVICWDRSDRSNHEIYEIDPSKGFVIPHGSQWRASARHGESRTSGTSFIMYYGYNNLTDSDVNPTDKPDVIMPDLHDLPDVEARGPDYLDNDAPMPTVERSTSSSDISSPTSGMSSRSRTPRDIDRRMAEKIIDTLQSLDAKHQKDNINDDHHDPDARPSNQQHGPLLPIDDNHDTPSSPSVPSTVEYQTADSDLDSSESTTTTYEPDLPMLYAQFLPEINAALDNYAQTTSSATIASYFSNPNDVYQDLSGRIFRVEADTDNLTWRDLYQHEKAVALADQEELQSFSTHEVWHPVEIHNATNIIDATWIRKWKMKDGKRVVKSRICARGCFDRQKPELLRSSAVASRLSQKLLVSNAANHGWPIESLDVSTAFLRGLTFAEVDQISRELGVPSPLTERRIHVMLPGNAWYWLYKQGAITQAQYQLARRKQLVMCLTSACTG